ncbi:MAG TPA: hypothetical protein VGK90_03945, partial [Rhizomicrobium sp.]
MTGKFFWYELMTSDVEAAQKFYGDVVGWGAQESGTAGYRLLTISEGCGVAGLMALPDAVKAEGGRPGWLGYVSAD